MSGDVVPGLILLAVFAALIGLGLWLRQRRARPLRRPNRPQRPPLRPARKPPAKPLPDTATLAVIDGSNVMYWRGNTPDVRAVEAVLSLLERRGYKTGVMFDANAGYKLTGRYLREKELAFVLGLKTDRVMVVPKGTQADPYLLKYAQGSGAILISNDRFRDRIADFPELSAPGRLVRGGYRENCADAGAWLDLPKA